jgi:hypothetical protein
MRLVELVYQHPELTIGFLLVIAWIVECGSSVAQARLTLYPLYV